MAVRELRDHLSRWLRHVKGGESLLITEHNRPVATVVPVRPPVPDGIVELVSTAVASWKEFGAKPRGCTDPPLVRGRRTLASMVAEDRR
ncbi:MAG: type II toxin-antitoxin system prevent-host-death family antitoxin [Bacillota bacterium]